MTRSARAPSLLRLDAYDDDENVIGVIETPRGTRTKLAPVVKQMKHFGMATEDE